MAGRGRPLELMEREAIALGIKKKMSYREIGDSIGRDHSVVSREIKRNGVRGELLGVAGSVLG
ncbi:hypothetical protein Atai01_69340 [Amycolatopsis taiwanensis]|uniref:Transposase IS30-like HTH domain-containing protein n=1 Tax=Amycolatopsis taiwanensis TaxID=342230 RepID=A0A9W6RAB7_9PSEU|nr:hypothetical protein Atai01_69340 [Amycolatopsis taiwanensis]